MNLSIPQAERLRQTSVSSLTHSFHPASEKVRPKAVMAQWKVSVCEEGRKRVFALPGRQETGKEEHRECCMDPGAYQVQGGG